MMNIAMQSPALSSQVQKLSRAWPRIKIAICAIGLLIALGVVSNMDYDDQVNIEQAKAELRLNNQNGVKK